MQDESFPEIIYVPTLIEGTNKNQKKAMLIPAKMMAFIELHNGEKFAIVHSCFKNKKKCQCVHTDGNWKTYNINNIYKSMLIMIIEPVT